jgi:hypothetical protein
MLGMSREGLAQTLGVKPRDVEDIENGAPQLSDRRLDQSGRALAVPVAFFFDDHGVSPAPAVTAMPHRSGTTSGQNQALRSALRLSLIAVELADEERGIDDGHYQAAKSTARTALVAE